MATKFTRLAALVAAVYASNDQFNQEQDAAKKEDFLSNLQQQADEMILYMKANFFVEGEASLRDLEKYTQLQGGGALLPVTDAEFLQQQPDAIIPVLIIRDAIRRRVAFRVNRMEHFDEVARYITVFVVGPAPKDA